MRNSRALCVKSFNSNCESPKNNKKIVIFKKRLFFSENLWISVRIGFVYFTLGTKRKSIKNKNTMYILLCCLRLIAAFHLFGINPMRGFAWQGLFVKLVWDQKLSYSAPMYSALGQGLLSDWSQMRRWQVPLPTWHQSVESGSDNLLFTIWQLESLWEFWSSVPSRTIALSYWSQLSNKQLAHSSKSSSSRRSYHYS